MLAVTVLLELLSTHPVWHRPMPQAMLIAELLLALRSGSLRLISTVRVSGFILSCFTPCVCSCTMATFSGGSLQTAWQMAQYPQLLALQAAADEDQAPDIPEGLPLSTAKLHEDGVYLFENGFEALIFIQRKAPPQLLRALFGEDLKAAELAPAPLCPMSHELSSLLPLKFQKRHTVGPIGNLRSGQHHMVTSIAQGCSCMQSLVAHPAGVLCRH